MRHLLLLALLLSSPSLYAAGGFSHSVSMDPESRDTIAVTSFIDNIPAVGFMPLKVTIDNRSATDSTWSLSPFNATMGGDWIQASWTFPVKAGSRAEFDILVPLKSGNFNYRWGSQYVWSGPGVDSPMMQLPQTSNSSGSNSTPFIALSDSPHALHWGTLQTGNSNLTGASIDLSQAPADWRAYIGLDQIWMGAQEWLAFPADKKQALLQSLALGSDLALLCKTEDEANLVRQSFGRQDPSNSNTWRIGSSTVKLLVGANITTSQIQSALRTNNSKGDLLANHRLSTYLDTAVAEISTAGPLVLIFIVLFGIIAGPVNLFVLAPAGRRHRLFITTPLISLGGAIILAAAIFIQDGTGGTGLRLIHAQLLPDQKQIVIQQEQASRTGLLLGSSFQTPPATWVQPLSGSTATQFNRTNNTFLINADGTYSGDWFRSRTRQSHLVTTVVPTRAAIEFTPGEQPSILSSFEVSLNEIYVRDSTGTLWRAKNVRPGTRMNLTREPSGMDEWNDQITNHQLAGLMKIAAEKPTHSSGTFYAITTDPGTLSIETLPAIRWKTPLTLISGPLTLK
jgi:hypothetical protein